LPALGRAHRDDPALPISSGHEPIPDFSNPGDSVAQRAWHDVKDAARGAWDRVRGR
jgi:hypothetical protein